MTVSLNQFEKEYFSIEQINAPIMPVFSVDSTTVCIVSSDEYAPLAAVTLHSIVCNASCDNFYDLVVLSDDMCVSNAKRLAAIAAGNEQISIRVLDISPMVKDMQFFTWAHFTNKTYYRLLTPDVFASYEKVLYLDSDVVVNRDIAKLYQENLSGCFFAATYDTHVMSYCTRVPALEQLEYNRTVLALSEPELYFQAGVMLFNVKALREQYGNGYLITEGSRHKLRWLDQDLINLLFAGKIKKISNQWNVMVANMPENLDEYYLPEPYRTDYYEARQNPYIIHYVGRALPCYSKKPDMYEYFWKYARQTAFYEILLQRMTIEAITTTEKQKAEQNNGLLKRFFVNTVNLFLPKGSPRRIWVKNKIFQLKKWN